MATETPLTSGTSADKLPDYIQAAKPNPNRAPWYTNTAPTYAGIFLWFVFWDQLPYQGGLNLGGLWIALLGVLVAAMICHFLFYLVPGLLGMQTGLPLYIVGTSTFGATGGLLMPGFLMGLLQFGWLAVNTFYSSMALATAFSPKGQGSAVIFYVICVVWAVLAAFVGLKGIQYVAKVATFLPLIPLAILIFALVKFGSSAGQFIPTGPAVGAAPVAWLALALMVTHIVGFFATAGAAGVDFGMSNRDKRDVNWGGLVGILLAILFTGGISTVVVAGARARGVVPSPAMDKTLAEDLAKERIDSPGVAAAHAKHEQATFTMTNSLEVSLSENAFKAIMIGLTLASFPGACFSSFIAANSFKTVMPRVNSFVSVGIGALVSILLAVTGVAGNLASVFNIIGASFGPIIGAMVVDYFLAGRKWPGPRVGFNPAGWGAWLLGFIVGILPNLHKLSASIPDLPAAPVAAFVVGAVVYFILAKIGMESRTIPYAPAMAQQPG